MTIQLINNEEKVMAIKKNKKDETAKQQIQRMMDEQGVDFYSKKSNRDADQKVVGKGSS